MAQIDEGATYFVPFTSLTISYGSRYSVSGALDFEPSSGVRFGIRQAGTTNWLQLFDNLGRVLGDGRWELGAFLQDIITPEALFIAGNMKFYVTAAPKGGGAILTTLRLNETMYVVNLPELTVRGDGNDAIAGTIDRDEVKAGGGSDLMTGSGGADTLDGGTGADTVSYTSSPAGIRVELAFSATQRGGDAEGDRLISIEAVVGSPHADALLGGAAGETLQGGEGEDSLDGQGGDDSLDGGAADDALTGGAGADRLSGGPGADVADYLGAQSAIGLNMKTGGFSGDATGDRLDSIEAVRGSLFNDTIIGDDTGGFLLGNGGADSLVGGLGADLLAGEGGPDTLAGGGGGDTLNGGAEADSLAGGGGDDSYVVDALDDRIYERADQGQDTVYASVTYTLSNHLEALLLTGMTGLGGNGNAVANRITGTTANDALSGRGGDDTMVGDNGADTLNGGAGKDRLAGGAGQDRVTGGGDADIFVFAVGDGMDVITDFRASQGDVLLLQGFGAALDSFAEIAPLLNRSGSRVVLSLSPTDRITINGVDLPDFSSDNVLFG
jgi:Ca2+-binding RTX toxin-like protein